MRWSWFQKPNKDVSIFKCKVIRNRRWKIIVKTNECPFLHCTSCTRTLSYGSHFRLWYSLWGKPLFQNCVLSGTLLFWIPLNSRLCNGNEELFSLIQPKSILRCHCVHSIVLGIVGKSECRRHDSCGCSPRPPSAAGSLQVVSIDRILKKQRPPTGKYWLWFT